MAKNAPVVSLRAKDATPGGGLVDDVRAMIHKPRFVLSDYGKPGRDTALVLQFDLIDGDGTKHRQYYSVGSKKNFTPSRDGLSLVPTGTRESLPEESNYILLSTHIENCDEELGEALAEGSIEVLDGKWFHWGRIPQPERKGMAQLTEAEDGDRRRGPKTLLVPDEVVKAPKGFVAPEDGDTDEDAPKTKSKSKARDEDADDDDEPKAKSKSKAKDDDEDEDDDDKGGKDEDSDLDDQELATILVEILEENGGKLKQNKLNAALFKHKAIRKLDRKGAAEALARLVSDDFLENKKLAKGKWSFDGTTVEGE